MNFENFEKFNNFEATGEKQDTEEIAELQPEEIRKTNFEAGPEKFNDSIEKEKSFLDKFYGPCKKIAQAMVLVSALSFGAGFAQKVEAGGPRKQYRVEQNIQNYGDINERNITGSGSWAQESLNRANSELSRVRTAEDAEWFIRSNIMEFVNEYFRPTKGDIQSVRAYGVDLPSRRYSQDDSKLILEKAQALRRIFHDLKARFNLMGFDATQENLDDIIVRTKESMSYAGQKQEETRQKFIEQLNRGGFFNFNR